MKAIALLFIALLIVSPAVFARASSFYQSSSNLIIIKPSSNISSNTTTAQRETYTSISRPQFKGLAGIYGVSVQKSPFLEQPGQIGTFGKPWLRKISSSVSQSILGGIANATPGISKAPCADFNCKASQYVVGDTSTKQYYRCWCEAAKSIKPENIKCLDTPGVAARIGYSEGKC